MGANNILTLDPCDLCNRVDEYLSCEIKSYIVYDKYKIGSKPSLRDMMNVIRLSRVVCGNRCLLDGYDLAKLSEKLNKIINL